MAVNYEGQDNDGTFRAPQYGMPTRHERIAANSGLESTRIGILAQIKPFTVPLIIIAVVSASGTTLFYTFL